MIAELGKPFWRDSHHEARSKYGHHLSPDAKKLAASSSFRITDQRMPKHYHRAVIFGSPMAVPMSNGIVPKQGVRISGG